MHPLASLFTHSLLLLTLPRLSQQVTISLYMVLNPRTGAVAVAECPDHPPGVCCRRIRTPPSNMFDWAAMRRTQGQYEGFKAASFEGMTSLDLGVAWTNDYSPASRYAWTSACGGRVYGVTLGAAGSAQTVFIDEAQSARRGGKIVGADHIHFDEAVPLMAAAEGIRAFLGGGGDLFDSGRSASSFGDASIAESGAAGSSSSGAGGAGPSKRLDTSDLADPEKASEVADRLAGSTSVYPSKLSISGTQFIQQGSRTSLLYRDDKTGTILDYSTKEPTACIDSWDCDINIPCKPQTQSLAQKALLYGAQLALDTIGMCQSSIS
ncbi:MAG: hypothetical protein M1812_006104 [Candelaria pacifica]|nr:MAG: hypothetical protein M1812_006104 [Candelaria pacifica]